MRHDPARGVIVDLQTAIVAVAGQRFPESERIANRRRRVRLARELQKRRLEPLAQRFKQRPGSLVANFSAFIGRPAADLFLNPVQGSDSLKGLPRYRRSVRLLQIIKLAPNVGPTCRFLNASVCVKLMKSITCKISSGVKLLH